MSGVIYVNKLKIILIYFGMDSYKINILPLYFPKMITFKYTF